MPLKYEYPEGMTADEKRKFRREARKSGVTPEEGGAIKAPPTFITVNQKTGQPLKYAYPTKLRTRQQKRKFRRDQRLLKRDADPNAPFRPSSAPEYLLDRLCLRCGEPFQAGFGEPMQVQPQGLSETWMVHLGCKILTDKAVK